MAITPGPCTSGIASLPRDPDILIEMIAGLRAENEKLRAMLETLKRAMYGARSEKRDADAAQLALGLGDLSALPVEPKRDAAAGGVPDPPKPTRPNASRNIGGLPNHLPREDVVIEPESDICPCCQGKLHRIGEDVSEMLDIEPAIIRVKRIRRPKYGCRACETAVVQAPAPPRPIDGGLPTAALLAHVAVSKFSWHLPLHRQTQMLAGQGIHLGRSTLVHWIERAAWWLGFLAGMRLRLDAWEPLLDLNRVDHGPMLPILLYCVDPSGRPMLGPPREGPETEEFLRTAYQDIPLVVPAIREFWMPERVREANGQR